MQLYPDKLATHLKGSLAPVYLISSEEPLQQQEAADAIRAAARSKGYEEREVLDVPELNGWNELAMAGGSMSLFASLKILDLRVASDKNGRPKVGKDGGAAIREYADNPPPDTLLLITMGKLDKRSMSAAWVQAVDAVGVVMRLWQIKLDKLPEWLDARMRHKGMRAEPRVARLLAERAEGNMLAAAQEVDKLQLLFGTERIDAEQAAQAVADSARYDVYGLVDAALAGNAGRAVHILEGLRAEGVAPPQVVWALTAEIRKMWSVGQALSQGVSQQQATRGVYGARAQLMLSGVRRHRGSGIRRLLQKCAYCDRVAKGQDGDATGSLRARPWDALLDLVNEMASA